MEEQAIQNLYKEYVEKSLKIKYKQMVIRKGSPRIDALYTLEPKDKTKESSKPDDYFNKIIELKNGNYLGEKAPIYPDKDYEYVFFDNSGKEVKRIEGMVIGNFHEGIAQIYNSNITKNKPVLCGYIDENGTIISDLQWGIKSGDFHCGRAIVESTAPENYGQRGVINEKGSLIIPCSFATIFNFSEDICCQKENNITTYYDKNGQKLFSCPNGGSKFSNGLVIFGDEKGKYGYKDKTGKTIIHPKFQEATDFENGIAKTKKGYINLDGESVRVASLTNGVKYIKGFLKPIYFNKIKSTYDKLECPPYKDLDDYLLCVDQNQFVLYSKKSGVYTHTKIPYESGLPTIERKENLLRINNKVFYLKALGCFELPVDLSLSEISSYVKSENLMSYREFSIAIRKDPSLYKSIKTQGATLEVQTILEDISEERKNQDDKRQEIINQLQDLKKALNELNQTQGSLSKIDASMLLYKVDDHYEIKPEFVGQLRFLDLSYISFANVKVSGLDFSGSNASINPQEVYKKDMSNGNFQGLNFVAKDFNNVNVKGATFAECNMDFATKEGAITDENTKFPQDTLKF